ncbi:phosphatase PAP2 family protein [Saccharicrinis sp. FJH62]|uniref:phosphatase PAP2 family protein n=1 Tax=Saccharicrinis sp. FJH62 TaxID=3344657 RepID=UPI0035D43076
MRKITIDRCPLKPVLFVLITFALLSFHAKSSAQVKDSTTIKSLIKTEILPASLIGAGSIISGSLFEKNLQTNLRNTVGNSYEFRIDDYMQYAPVAELYLADLCGVKAKNHWFDQTKYLIISNVITASITHGLKFLTLKTRPTGARFSFPSGHTTLAFTNATVLYHEFNETSPLLAYSGFAFSTATASFRMINNKHWLSDVMVGAGIGLLVTHLVYHFEPLKNFNPFKKDAKITIIPQFDDHNPGLYAVYSF